METINHYCITRLTFCDDTLSRKGFELRYYDPEQQANALEASAKVASFALMDYGLDQAGEDGRIILPISTPWLSNTQMLPSAKVKDRLIFELSSDIPADPVTLCALRQIRQKGFQVALADYRPDDPRSMLLSEVDLIRIDSRQLILQEIKTLQRELSRYPLQLMCCNIESWQAYNKLKLIGFDFYQGSFIGKPELLDTPKNSTNRLILVKLMTLLFDDKSSIAKIEQVIEQEPTLFYRLLKFVNSAAYRLPNKIDSLHQAVVYMGTETLCTLVAILVWAKDDHKAYTLLPQILTRAKSCELIAREAGLAPADRYFTLGFLSLLDVALDQPLERLIQNLSLSDVMTQALIDNEGPLVDVLNFVRLWENADWEALQQQPLFQRPAIAGLMQEAQTWSNQVEAAMREE